MISRKFVANWNLTTISLSCTLVFLFVVNHNVMVTGNEYISVEEDILQLLSEDILTSGNATIGDSGSGMIIDSSIISSNESSTFEYNYYDSISSSTSGSGTSSSSRGSSGNMSSYYSSYSASNSESIFPTVPDLPPPVSVIIPPSSGFNSGDSSTVGVPCDDCDTSPMAPIPTSTRYCREFETSNTKNATENTCSCNFDACAGETILINACHCDGNPLLRFNEVASNTEISLENGNLVVDYSLCNNGCPSYYFTNHFPFPCRLFSISGGCAENEACSARAKVSHALFFHSMSKQSIQQMLTAITVQNTTNKDDAYYYYSDDTHNNTTTDDDGYLNTPNPYLETVCPNQDDDYNNGTLIVSGFIIGAVCLAAGGCCLLGLLFFAVKYFYPDFVQSLTDRCLKWSDTTVLLLTSFVFCGFNNSAMDTNPGTAEKANNKPMFNLKKRGGESVIVPVCTSSNTTSSVVELTPWEKRQGFFRSSIDSQIRRLTSSNCPMNNINNNNNTKNNHVDPEAGYPYFNEIDELDYYGTYGGDDEDDDDEDNISQMGELEDDDPRVLRKLARKYKEQQLQLAHAHLRTPLRHKPSPPSQSPLSPSPQYIYGNNVNNIDDNTNVIYNNSQHHPHNNADNNINNNIGISQKTLHQAPQVSFSLRSQQTQHTARIYPSSTTSNGSNNANSSSNNRHRHFHSHVHTNNTTANSHVCDESVSASQSGDISYISLTQQQPSTNTRMANAADAIENNSVVQNIYDNSNNKTNNSASNGNFHNNNNNNNNHQVASVFSYDRHLLDESAPVSSFAQSQPLVCYFDEELGDIPFMTHHSNTSLNDL